MPPGDFGSAPVAFTRARSIGTTPLQTGFAQDSRVDSRSISIIPRTRPGRSRLRGQALDELCPGGRMSFPEFLRVAEIRKAMSQLTERARGVTVRRHASAGFER